MIEKTSSSERFSASIWPSLGLIPLLPPTSSLHPLDIPIKPISFTAGSAQEFAHPDTPILNFQGSGMP